MVYTTYTDIALMTNLTTADIANADITSIITESTKELNGLINVSVIREPVLYIDVTRKNQINSSNTTFYIQNWKSRFFADDNDDGTVTTSDLIVYSVGTDGTETLPTIASIDTSKGSFTLSSAPSSGKLYVTYSWCLRNPYTPDPLIKLACTLLTSAYCYAKINFGRSPQVSFGNTKIYRHIEAFDLYYKRFMKVVNQINNQMPDSKLSEEGI